MADDTALTWARTRADMACDRSRLAAWLGFAPGPLHRGLWSLRLYRLARWMFGRRGLRFPARMIWALNLILTRADLDPNGVIGPGTIIPDPYGVILSGDIGPNCTIGRGTGVGGILRSKAPPPDFTGHRPEISAGVVLGANVMVLGALRIGRGARIGDGCSVMESVPAGARLDARESAWRALRVPAELAPRPDPALAKGLFGRIRTDVQRAVLENSGQRAVGTLRFWAHLIMPSVTGVAMFRVAQALHAAGWRRAGAFVAHLITVFSGMVLHPGSAIGPGLFIPHAVGVRFCGSAAPNLTLYPHAKVGPVVWPPSRDAIPAGAPVLGTNVRIGAQGEVVGAVHVGDNAMVGVQVRVTRDLGPGLTAVARPNWRMTPGARAENEAQADLGGARPAA